MYIHVYFVHRTVYMYTKSRCRFISCSPGVSSRHPGSHPSTPHAVCVRVRTHTHNTYLEKWGDSAFAQTNPSHCKQTPTIDQLEKPRSPLLYIRMQWCLQHLWIALKTPVEHTYAKRIWPPQNESKWWLRWQARQWQRAKNCYKRRWHCTSPPGLRRQQAGTSSSPNPPFRFVMNSHSARGRGIAQIGNA